MRLVAKCAGIRIYINPFDHAPPHVHVYQAEYEAVMSIAIGEIMSEDLPGKTYNKVKKWILFN